MGASGPDQPVTSATGASDRPELFTSQADVRSLSPYELAREFCRLPELVAERDRPEVLLHDLVVTSALARATAGWTGLGVHQAVLAGVDVDEVVGACAQGDRDLDTVFTVWREWADGQIAHGFIEPEVADAVARKLCTAPIEQGDTAGGGGR